MPTPSAESSELFVLARCLIRVDGKPRIAAVKGICSGGANEIAFACDLEKRRPVWNHR